MITGFTIMRAHHKFRWNNDDYRTLLTALKTVIRREEPTTVECVATIINSSEDASFVVISDCDQQASQASHARGRSIKSIHMQLHRFNLASQYQWMFSDITGSEKLRIMALRNVLVDNGFQIFNGDIGYVRGNKKGDGSLTPIIANHALCDLNLDNLKLAPRGQELITSAIELFPSKSDFIDHLVTKFSKKRATVSRLVNYKPSDTHPRPIPQWIVKECMFLTSYKRINTI